MKIEELTNKVIDVDDSQMSLLIESHAILSTILSIIVDLKIKVDKKTKKTVEAEVNALYTIKLEATLDLLTFSDDPMK
jgi:hypothetical protein